MLHAVRQEDWIFLVELPSTVSNRDEGSRGSISVKKWTVELSICPCYSEVKVVIDHEQAPQSLPDQSKKPLISIKNL